MGVLAGHRENLSEETLKMKKSLSVMAMAAAIAMSAPAMAQDVNWATGPVGGGWYVMSTGIAKMLADENSGMNVKVLPGAGTANPTRVNNRQAELGFGIDMFIAAAINGGELFKGVKHENLRMVAGIGGDVYTHFLRAKGAPHNITSFFTKANDASIAVAPAGTATEVLFRYLAEHFNTGYEDLRKRGNKVSFANYNDMASQFKDRQINYAFGTLGLPGASFVEMAISRDSELVSFTKEEEVALKAKFGFKFGDIPAGTYPKAQSGPVNTVLLGSGLFTHDQVSEDTIYKITKTLCANEAKLHALHESLNDYKCATTWKDLPGQLHPGAARFYKEKKLM
jgi:TRAP transporter TAXI family solute receptor